MEYYSIFEQDYISQQDYYDYVINSYNNYMKQIIVCNNDILLTIADFDIICCKSIIRHINDARLHNFVQILPVNKMLIKYARLYQNKYYINLVRKTFIKSRQLKKNEKYK